MNTGLKSNMQGRCTDFSAEHQGFFYSFGSPVKGAKGHPIAILVPV